MSLGSRMVQSSTNCSVGIARCRMCLRAENRVFIIRLERARVDGNIPPWCNDGGGGVRSSNCNRTELALGKTPTNVPHFRTPISVFRHLLVGKQTQHLSLTTSSCRYVSLQAVMPLITLTIPTTTNFKGLPRYRCTRYQNFTLSG